MPKSYVAMGIVTDGRIVELDEPVPLRHAKVRVHIEPLPFGATRPLGEVIAEIRAQQAERQFVPPTREEVDRFLAKEREGWDR